MQVAWSCLGWQTCLFPAEMLNALWNTVDKYPHKVAFRFVSSRPDVSDLFIILCLPFFHHYREIAPCSLKECHERTITWATVLNESKAVARAIMVAPSEKVLISAREGSIRWVECVLGALFSGGVPTHINPSCSHAQFKQCIETCQTRWLFIEDKLVC